MGEAVSYPLEFDAEWEFLQSGPPEEKACFAALGIRHGATWMTEADDRLAKRIRTSVYVSTYPLAQWLAWNWWRLRWEPESGAPAWALAHRLSSVGGGYVWPNITIASDGERVALTVKPTRAEPSASLRYIADLSVAVGAAEFEAALDRFLGQVQAQLRAEGVAETNFDRIWNAVREERADPDAALWRRFEAMLGFDPDEADPSLIERMVADTAVLGKEAVAEIAAEHAGGEPPSRQHLIDLAGQIGFDAHPADAVRLSAAGKPRRTEALPAWRRGAEMAKALRVQEKLGSDPIPNARLSAMCGLSGSVLGQDGGSFRFAFALDRDRTSGAVVLRSKYETGRRFDLARLLGDRLSGDAGTLFPATAAYTYRQKLQRAFAAELLCPFEALEEMLGEDRSAAAVENAAQRFGVSELTVRTLLVNHGRLGREDLIGDTEAMQAA